MTTPPTGLIGAWEKRVRVCVAGLVAWAVCGGVAYAQTHPTIEQTDFYVSVVGQSAFGNVTSQSFGVEGGYTLTPQLQIVAELGRVLDAATKDLGPSAQAMAGQVLVRSNGATVDYTVKEPVTFGAASVKYLLPFGGKMQPYVLGGLGIAQVKHNVQFIVGGTDVTDSLSQSPFFITLGGDLSGSVNKGMLVLGGGATLPLTGLFFADFDFRYDKVFGSDISIGRAGLGLGIRF